jgi:general secretion pathway protein C
MAGVVGGVITERLVSKKQSAPGVSEAVASPVPQSKPVFTGSLSRNIFNSAQGPEDISQISEDEMAILPEAGSGIGISFPKTTLGLKLIGTIIDPLGVYRLAAIEVKDTKEQKLYKTGDTALGARIAMILRNRVVLSRAGKLESLDADFTIAESGTAGKTMTGVEMMGQDVNKLSDTQYAVSKRYLNSQLASMSQLLTDVRAVPNVGKDGVTDGFKVFAIRKGSLFDKIGLQNNDVLKRINGIEIDSAEKGLELFQALKNETSFNVDLMRQSQKTTMRFTVQ